jgi:hypothetical protein
MAEIGIALCMLFLGGRMDKFRAADSKGSVADHQVKKETRFQAIFVRRGPRIFVRSILSRVD